MWKPVLSIKVGLISGFLQLNSSGVKKIHSLHNLICLSVQKPNYLTIMVAMSLGCHVSSRRTLPS